ncbi:MAG: UDP-2,3-diacylglucosamine pyrophosphatase LpxH [Kiritimatiellia bacterium]|jgi:UDP-2,3-diacylglucosamine pyrophosphatase LpxH
MERRACSGVRLSGWSRPKVTEAVAEDQTIWFISDLHLGDGTPSDAFFGKDRALMALVKRVEKSGALLVVVGDAMDLQQAWTFTRILKAHQDLLGAMSRLGRQGRLVYIVGNHDSDISLYRNLLNFRVCDALHVGERILVTHGYEHDPYIGTQLEHANLLTKVHHLSERYLDTWLRIPLREFYTGPNRLLFWMVHKIGLTALGLNHLGNALGVQGVAQTALDRLNHFATCNMGDPMGMFPSVMAHLQQGPWQYLVCGHSHLPGMVRHPNNPNRSYINTGTWTFASSHYVVWDGDQFTCKDWITGRTYGDELYQPLLTGAYAEKDFWQWWRENYMGWMRFRQGEESRGRLRGWESYVRDHQHMAKVNDVQYHLPAPAPDLDPARERPDEEVLLRPDAEAVDRVI